MLHCLAHALCVHYLAAIEIEHEPSKTREGATPSKPFAIRISIRGHVRSVYALSSSSPRDNAEFSSDDGFSK